MSNWSRDNKILSLKHLLMNKDFEPYVDIFVNELNNCCANTKEEASEAINQAADIIREKGKIELSFIQNAEPMIDVLAQAQLKPKDLLEVLAPLADDSFAQFPKFLVFDRYLGMQKSMLPADVQLNLYQSLLTSPDKSVIGIMGSVMQTHEDRLTKYLLWDRAQRELGLANLGLFSLSEQGMELTKFVGAVALLCEDNPSLKTTELARYIKGDLSVTAIARGLPIPQLRNVRQCERC